MVTRTALRYGRKLAANHLETVHCPDCNQLTTRFYDGASRGYYAQCLNPECPYINKRKDETQMPTVTAVKNETIPTGDYLFQVVNIEDETGNYGPQFKWTFEVTKPEKYAGKQLVGWCSQSPSIKGKFMKWSGSCQGRTIEPGESVDTDDNIGCQVVGTVIIDTGDDGSDFNKITGIRAPKTPATKKQTGKASEGFDVGEPEKPAEDVDGDPFVDE